jgi:hypothetical protein
MYHVRLCCGMEFYRMLCYIRDVMVNVTFCKVCYHAVRYSKVCCVILFCVCMHVLPVCLDGFMYVCMYV